MSKELPKMMNSLIIVCVSSQFFGLNAQQDSNLGLNKTLEILVMKSCNETLLVQLSYFDIRRGPTNGLNVILLFICCCLFCLAIVTQRSIMSVIRNYAFLQLYQVYVPIVMCVCHFVPRGINFYDFLLLPGRKKKPFKTRI